MKLWNLTTLPPSTQKETDRAPGPDAPRVESDGRQIPRVLFSSPECRAVIIELRAGEEMGEHRVRERALVQVVSGSVLGSLEYAVAVLHIPLILVLGHDSCGAVASAIASQAADAEPLPPHIADLIAPIVPAVHRVTGPGAVDPRLVDASAVGREHLRDTVSELLARSEIIASAVAENTLGIVGANYRLAEGRAVPDVVVGVRD